MEEVPLLKSKRNQLGQTSDVPLNSNAHNTQPCSTPLQQRQKAQNQEHQQHQHQHHQSQHQQQQHNIQQPPAITFTEIMQKKGMYFVEV